MRVVPAFVLLLWASVTSAAPAGYRYVSPVPGSRYVSPGNTIVLKPGAGVGRLDAGTIEVQGSRSGRHPGTLRLVEDAGTVIFVPATPFAAGERVTVSVNGLEDGLPPLTFDFEVSNATPRRSRADEEPEFTGDTSPRRDFVSPLWGGVLGGGPIPVTYPPILIHIADPADPGNIFMTPNPAGASSYGNIVVLDWRGQPVFYRKTPARASDLRVQPNGLLTYFDQGAGNYKALDYTLALVDSFAMGNGYETDSHDLQILPNGNALLMAYDDQPVRMDLVVPGGNPNAIVTGLILQEIDENKNVVFQWRSWDHFAITDAVDCVVNLLGANVDYCHGNSVSPDNDGNLLISSRHMNEITKISRATGDILWRFGPNAVNNQFTVIGDTRGFSHQHDARRLPNGNLTLFDNGNCLSPEYSRALEYALDEVNHTATLVWEYRNTPDIYGRATGNNQRRGSGTMINWGFGDVVTDLAADDTKVFEVTFGQTNMRTYRALRQPWQSYNYTLGASGLHFGPVAMYQTRVLPLSVQNLTQQPIEIDYFISSDSLEFRVTDPMPLTLGPGASHEVSVQFRPVQAGLRTASLYARAVNDTELVAQSVDLDGTGSGETDVAELGGESPLVVSPTPARGPASIRFTLTRESSVRLEVLDIQGRTVALLADEPLPAGSHERFWVPGPSEPPGLHFVRWSDGRETRTAKLVRIR